MPRSTRGKACLPGYPGTFGGKSQHSATRHVPRSFSLREIGEDSLKKTNDREIT